MYIIYFYLSIVIQRKIISLLDDTQIALFVLLRLVVSCTTCLYEFHGGCFIISRNCLHLARTSVEPRLLVVSMFFVFVFIFLAFCAVVVLFVFVLCFVCPMLSVSLDCPFWIVSSVFSNVYFGPVSCVPNFASVSRLSILDFPFGFR